MTRIAPLLAGACLALPSLALAQEPAASVSAADRPAATFDELERGVYVALRGGPAFVVNPPAPADAARPFSSGQMAQVELGMDLGERLSVGLFLTATANRAGTEYGGFSQGRASGDFSSLVPGASLRFSALGFQDAQQLERTWLYLRGGVGLALFSPRQLLPDPDILVFAGPGLEYYTRLRHFSVGIELTGTYLVTSGAVGFALTPSLRYAF